MRLLIAFGGYPLTRPVAFGTILLGMLLVFWALNSRTVRRTSGYIAKLKLLSRNYGEGPDLFGRVFFGGIAFIAIGIFALTVLR